SKIEAGKFHLDQDEFDLRSTLEETICALALPASEKGLELTYYVQPLTPERCFGDAMRLNQVVTNLVNNAIKFTEQGEVLVRVGVEGRNGAKTILHFEVADTGIGISPADQQRIFAPFTQADASSTRAH